MPTADPPADRSGVDGLRALQQQLNDALDRLIADAASPLPSLDTPTRTTIPPVGPVVVARAAAKRIEALLGGQMHTFEAALSFHVPACLRVAVEAHVVELLREHAEKTGDVNSGVPAADIARASGIDAAKLARVLRVLAAHHIFREVATDSFANNRCSLALDTGKSVKDLMQSKDMWTGTDGMAALIAHVTDDAFKAAAYMSDALLDPAAAHSYDAAQAPIARAFGIDTAVWEFWALLENAHLLQRFGYAMKGTQLLQHGQAGALTGAGFPFASLAPDAVVVDVGGGVGGLSLEILKVASHVKIVVQDRPETIAQAQEVWQSTAPEPLASGRVTLVSHDFFTPQPVTNADVFVLRFILHDWSDTPAGTILSHLAAAAQPSTRLVLIEQAYVPLSDGPAGGLVPSTFPYLIDSQMLVVCNAQERTAEQYVALGEKNGWKFVQVYKTGKGGVEEGRYRHYEFRPARPAEQ